MIAGTLLSVSERAERRAIAQRDKFWASKLEAEQSERQQAESERQQAESERQQAESERQRAESEWQRAESERQQAESERQQADIKCVRKLCAEGWQDMKIAQTLDLDIETVRLYAGL